MYGLNEHWLRQEDIYATEHTIRFPDRFAVVNFHLRVRTIRFPASGAYEFVFFVDADKVFTDGLIVYQRRQEPSYEKE